MYLYLDDQRIPSDSFNYTEDACYTLSNWKVVKDYNSFKGFIKRYYEFSKSLPELISFDHDIKGPKTGYDCAKFLIDFCEEKDLQLPKYKVHSMNPVGKDNINYLLKGFKRHQEEKSLQ